MRRAAVAFGLILGIAVGVAAAAVGIASASPHPATASPARLFVSAKEFSLIASRQRLKAGPARIQLYNAGEDAHDLRLKRVSGTRELAIPETAPGKVNELRATLRSGTWKLYCSVPGHKTLGMRATIYVEH